MKKSKQEKQNKQSFAERFKTRAKNLLVLFWSMFKIGLFTFGGGYAMIHLLENEFVAKKKWLDNEEFFDLVTIAESTPGPVAINCSTYIGYKTEKYLGATIATTAMCLPSFIIIYVISLFFNAFLANPYVAAAFKGIQVCAVFLILCAGIKMAKKIKFSIFNIAIFLATFAAMIAVSVLGAKFSSIFYILISGAIGLFIYSIGYFKNKLKTSKIANDYGKTGEIGSKANSSDNMFDITDNLKDNANENAKCQTKFGINEQQNTQINMCQNTDLLTESQIITNNESLTDCDCENNNKVEPIDICNNDTIGDDYQNTIKQDAEIKENTDGIEHLTSSNEGGAK